MARPSKGPWPRKSGGWWVWFGGRQRWLGDTEADAWRAWHLLHAGEEVQRDGASFSAVSEAYHRHLKRNRSERHAWDVEHRLRAFRKALGHRQVVGLRWADVEAVLDAQDWNPTTTGGALTALKGCLRYAVRSRLIPENPIPHITIPRAESRQNALSKAEVAKLLRHAGPLRELVWFLSVTGARPGEAIQARVDDCDGDGTAVRLTSSKVGRRVIYLPKAERKRMATIRKSQKVGPLFPAVKGGRWCRSTFCAAFRKARDRAGLPKWATAYSLRHTWITERLRPGRKRLSHEDVAALAGTSVAMIERTYKHLIDADVKRIADRL